MKTPLIINKLLAYSLNHRKLAGLFLGLILASALPPYHFYLSAVLAFSGALFLCLKTPQIKTLLAIGYCFGFGFFSAGLYWIGNALLVAPEQTGWLYLPTLVLNGAFFGLFATLPFVATKISSRIEDKILLFAAVWMLFTEWFRGIFLTGFPWNPISSILAFSPAMLQSLAWWGTYGLSFIVIVCASSFAFWFNKPNHKNLIKSCYILAIPTLFLYLSGRFILSHPTYTNDKPINVRLVQPSISQSLKWDDNALERNFDTYVDLSKMPAENNLDFVIWGETASTFDLTRDVYHNHQIRSAIPENGYLITGTLRYERRSRRHIPYNSLAVINKDGHILSTYDKNHLVPFGEYIPFRRYLPKWIRPLTNNVAEFGRGKKYQTISIGNYPEFAPLICYEIIFSNEVVRKKDKPKWMVVLTNDGWYGISTGPYQHLVAAQMRAIEEGIAVVRSANSGISAVISPYGEIVASIPLAQTGFSDSQVPLNQSHFTLFGRFGNTIPLLLCGITLLIAFLRHKKNKTPVSPK